MENKLLICGSAIAVVVLVLASFSPVVGYKTLESEDEFIEFEVEFCGLGQKHTVQLTQEKVEELDILFDEIKLKLDVVETREETVEIFNEAIVELDEYRLLGEFSAEQVKKLVTSKFQNQRFMNILNQLSHRPLNDNENRYCLIVGRTNQTVFFGGIFYFLVERPSQVYNMLRPLKLFSTVSFGRYIDHYTAWEYLPANGWVWTDGSNGVKEWNGSLYGQISTIGYHDMISGYLFFRFYVGATRFKGISIYFPDGKEIFLLGHAAQVSIDTHLP